MAESPQSETLHSHIMQLLEEQKYDEALPILIDLTEKTPSDRELQMYHLLVLRILVLRWNLSRIGDEKNDSGIREYERLASAVCVPHTTKFGLTAKLTNVLHAARKQIDKMASLQEMIRVRRPHGEKNPSEQIRQEALRRPR
jgi:hypothetical protein